MVVQTVAGTLGEALSGALFQGIDLVQEVDDQVHRPHIRIRAKVFPPVPDHPPGLDDPGKGLVQRDLDIGIGLIVPQQHVVPGHVFFDEVVFQDQGFHL